MKKSFLLLVVLCLCWSAQIHCQSNLQYTLGINFPAYGLPVYRLSENFRNIGFNAGVAYPLNKPASNALRLDFGFNHTRAQGNNFYVQSQYSFHPVWKNGFETGVDLGVGFQWAKGNGEGWLRNPNGEWQSSANVKRLLYVPIGLHLGYRVSENWRPFVQYQIQAITGYNEVFPIFPVHVLTLGQTFKF
jgi:hypothetical protein